MADLYKYFITQIQNGDIVVLMIVSLVFIIYLSSYNIIFFMICLNSAYFFQVTSEFSFAEKTMFD